MNKRWIKPSCINFPKSEKKNKQRNVSCKKKIILSSPFIQKQFLSKANFCNTDPR